MNRKLLSGISLVIFLFSTIFASSVFAANASQFTNNQAPTAYFPASATNKLILDLTLPTPITDSVLAGTAPSAGTTITGTNPWTAAGGVRFYNGGTSAWQSASDVIVTDNDKDGVYTSAADTAVDCDGSNTADVGTCTLISAGTALDRTASSDQLCTNSLTNPTAIRINTNTNCATGTQKEGTYILGTSATAASIAVGTNWAYYDGNGDNNYDNGEDLYIENVAGELTYSASADTLLAGTAPTKGTALDSANPWDGATQPVRFYDGGTVGTWESGSDAIIQDLDASGWYNADKLSSIKISNTGTATDSDISAIKIWQESGATEGFQSGEDTLIGSDSSGTKFTATITTGSATVFTSSSANRRIYATVDIVASPTNGRTFITRLVVDSLLFVSETGNTATELDGPSDSAITNTNTQTIDKLAPSAPTYNTAENQWFNSNPTLNIDFSDNLALEAVEYKVDSTGTYRTIATGISGISYTTDWSITSGDWDAMSQGTHYLYFRLTDDAGNVNTTPNDAAGFTIKKDTVAPTYSFNSPATDSVYKNGATISVDATITESGSGITNGATCTPAISGVTSFTGTVTYSTTTQKCTGTLTITNGGADGAKQLTLTVADIAGNSQISSNRQIQIDNTAPTTADDYVAKNNIWQNADQTITLTPNDAAPSSGIEWTRYCTDTTNLCDPATGTSYTVPVTITTEGINYFRYASKDNAGNVQTTVSRTVKIDKAAPTGGSITYTDGYYTATSVPITYTTGTDTGSSLNTTSGKIQRASATLSGGSCGTFGSFSDLVTESDGGYTDTSVTNGNCYKYQYIISDNAGNTATYTSSNVAKIDTVAPTTTDNTIAPSWGNSDVTVTLTPSDSDSGIASTKYCIYDVGGSVCNPSAGSTGTSVSVTCSSGTTCKKIVRYFSADNAGNNESSHDSNEIWIDKENPSIGTVTITPSSGSFISGISAISASVTETGSGVAACQYTIDGSTWNAATFSSGTCSASGVGTSSASLINIRATDNVGNVGTGSAVTVTPDTSAPSTNDSSDTAWHNTDQTIILTPSDNSGSGIANTYYCVDAAGNCTPATNGTSVPVSCASDNVCQQYVRYYSVDNLGNNESVKTSNLVKIDKVNPTGSLTGVPLNWQNTDASITLGCSDTDSGCDGTKDYYCTDTTNSCDPNTEYAGAVTISSHVYFRWNVTDNAGNINTGSSEILVDKINPTADISGAPTDWVNTNQTATVTCSDTGGSDCDVTSYKIKTYFSDPGTCPSDYTQYSLTSPQTISSHLWICAAAKDNAGNTGYSSPVEFKVDETKPTTAINTPDASSWQKTNFDVGLTDGDTGNSGLSTCYYRVLSNDVETKTWTTRTCSASVTLTTGSGQDCIDEGTDKCKIEAYATDAAGNNGDTVSRTFSIDWTAPTASITSPSENSHLKGTVTINANASDSGSGIEKVEFYYASIGTKIGEDTTAPYSIDWNTTSTTDGGHGIYVEVYDNAGNSYNSSSVSIVVDNTPPVVTVPSDITANATGPAGATVTFSASATDNIDGSLAASCDPSSGSTFSLSTTTVTCTATDNAGNIGSNTFNVTVQDTTPPTITVPSDITQEATSASGAVVTYTPPTATDLVDGSVSVSCNHTSGDTFPLGTTTVACTSTDLHSNTGTASFTVKVQDTTAPQYSNNQTSPTSLTNYSPMKQYNFNVTWTDNTEIDSVLFEFNGNNYTMNRDGNIFYYTLIDLPANTYNYRFIATDTSGNQNSTSMLTYTISKATPAFSTNVTSSITYGNASDYAGSESNTGDTGCTYNLLRNGINIGTGSSVSDNTVLSAGDYNYTYYTDGCTNYTSAQDEKTLTVNKGTPTGTVSSSAGWNVTYPASTTISYSEANIGDDDCSYAVWRDSINIGSGETITLGAGDYNYKLNVSGCGNWTDADNIDPHTLTVSKGATTVDLLLNGTSSNITIASGSAVNTTVTVSNTQGTIYLDKNQVNVLSATGATSLYYPSAYSGVPGYEWNMTGYYPETQNYSAASKTWYIKIESTPPTFTNLASNVINNTVIGKYDGAIEIDAQWNDDFALDKYWLSLNGTVYGTPTSFASGNWSNITIDPSTFAPGTVLQAIIYANDTSNNQNQTPIFQWTIDGTNPVLNNTTPVNGTYIYGTTSQLFQVYVYDDTLNTTNVTLYHKRSTAAWKNANLNCYNLTSDNKSFVCNTTLDMPTWYGHGDVVQYYFAATDRSRLFGSSGTADNPLTVTLLQTFPKYSNNNTNATLIGKHDAVLIYAYWTDDNTLDKAVLETNETGVPENKTAYGSPLLLNGSASWSNFTWSNSSVASGSVIEWKIYANNSVGSTNVTAAGTFAIDGIPPTYSQNSTDSTSAGTAILHSLEWQDNLGLSGYIFSFDNGDGSFVNDSFVAFSGTTNWSNATKVVNSTVGSVIRWCVYTNDTSDNWNETSCSDPFSYTVTTLEVGKIKIIKNTVGGDSTFNFTISGPNSSSPSITTVGGNGTTGFITVDSGSYSISETVPSGWSLTNSSCDSGTPSSFSVPSNGSVTCTFNNAKKGQVRGIIFKDVNGNELKDPGEPILQAWTVYADLNNNGLKDPGEPEDGTNVDGSYSLPLAPGNYTIREVPQLGWIITKPVGGKYTVTITSGLVISGNDFGNFIPGSISGIVFRDTNGNRIRDAGEIGLSGWTIYLDLNHDGLKELGEPTAVTDSYGKYQFTDLRAGSYDVREVLQSGWVNTTPTGGKYVVGISSNAAVNGKDFGNRQGSISGIVFKDLNKNGNKSLSEPGLSSWTVYLDLDHNGVKDPLEPTRTTDSSGKYSFVNLAPGTYYVRELVRSGWTQTNHVGGASVTITNANITAGKSLQVDFGNIPTTTQPTTTTTTTTTIPTTTTTTQPTTTTTTTPTTTTTTTPTTTTTTTSTTTTTFVSGPYNSGYTVLQSNQGASQCPPYGVNLYCCPSSGYSSCYLVYKLSTSSTVHNIALQPGQCQNTRYTSLTATYPLCQLEAK